MQRNLKKREFLVADKQLAELLVQRASVDPECANLLRPFQAYLADLNHQLDTYEGV